MSESSTSTPRSYRRGGPRHLVTGDPLNDRGDLKRHFTEMSDIIGDAEKKRAQDQAASKRETDHHLAWLAWEIRRDNIISNIRQFEQETQRLLAAEFNYDSLRAVGEETRLQIADRRRRSRQTNMEERSLIESLMIIE